MRIPAKFQIKALLAVGVVGASGLASAQSASQTAVASIKDPAFVAGLVTTTGVSTAATIGATVGAIAGSAGAGGGGFGSFAALPAGVTRFALPGQGGTGAAAAPGAKALNAWVAVSRNDVSFDYAPMQSSGKVTVGLVGIDYTLANKVVLGLAIAGDRTAVDLKGTNFTAGSKMTGRGTTYSPYAGIPINKNWSADVSLGWGKTTVKTDLVTFDGTMQDKRQTAGLGLSYRQLVAGDKWMLTGRGSYLWVKDKLGAYTMSNGTFVSDGTVKVSQARFGGQAAYNAGLFVPYAGLNYIYDISAPSIAGAANDRDAFQGVLGIKFNAPSGLYGGLQYSSEVGRSQIKNNQIMLNLGARF